MISTHKIVILLNFSIFSSGIKSILERKGIKVLGQANHWNDFFELLQTTNPDALLIDLLQYNDSCTGSLDQLRVEYAHIPVVLIINENCADYLADFILMGVTGFVSNDTTPEQLVKAIDCVANDHEYFAEGILTRFKQNLQSRRTSLATSAPIHKLTERETAVCKLFCNGLTYKEIGEELFISPRTVETHKKNILAKLKMKSTVDMVKYAIHHRMI